MQFFPKLTLGLWNGWIFLLIYGVVFGGVVRSFPQDVIARLYDTSDWTPTQRTIVLIGKALSLLVFIMVALTPINITTGAFWIGSAIFVLGLSGVVVALFNFRDTPPGEPATQGLYKVSRNPQWVMLIVTFLGTGIAVGSWSALLFLVLGVICYHIRILAEEQTCLAKYGDSYRAYMQKIPRYFGKNRAT